MVNPPIDAFPRCAYVRNSLRKIREMQPSTATVETNEMIEETQFIQNLNSRRSIKSLENMNGFHDIKD